MSRWHDLGWHVLPARHVRCEWALVVDNGKTKMSLSRSSRTNILKSPANAIWRPCGHLMKYGHYPTCNSYLNKLGNSSFYDVLTNKCIFYRILNNGLNFIELRITDHYSTPTPTSCGTLMPGPKLNSETTPTLWVTVNGVGSRAQKCAHSHW